MSVMNILKNIVCNKNVHKISNFYSVKKKKKINLNYAILVKDIIIFRLYCKNEKSKYYFLF